MRKTLRQLNVLRVLGAIPAPVPPVPTVAPLRFTNNTDTPTTIGFSTFDEHVNIEYRIVGTETWSSFYATVTIDSGEAVEFRGNNESRNEALGSFTIAGSDVDASGSVMSLIYGESLNEYNNLVIPNVRAFKELFAGSTHLLTPPELPAVELTQQCYEDMFADSGITTAPELPAVDMKERCYAGMFRLCSALTTPPQLPSTTLLRACYSSMFAGSGITTPPSLPATTLITECYSSMFYECANLTKAPDLPAQTLADHCYSLMFLRSGVDRIKVDFVSWHVTATQNWLYGVLATGTFRCPAALDTSIRDASHIPAGWTIETF